jgi:hypothetical protein
LLHFISDYLPTWDWQTETNWMDDALSSYFSDIVMQNMDKISYKHIRREIRANVSTCYLAEEKDRAEQLYSLRFIAITLDDENNIIMRRNDGITFYTIDFPSSLVLEELWHISGRLQTRYVQDIL